MEKNRKNRGVVTLLLMIIIILTVLCVLFATDTINLGSNVKEDSNTNLNTNTSNNQGLTDNKDNDNTQELVCDACICPDEKKCDDSINFDELDKIKKLTYNYVNYDRVDDNIVAVLDNGKVIINWNSYISNISNAKDVKIFAGPGTTLIYILTKDGNVYEYDYDKLNDENNTDFEAKKIDKYHNIKRIITYHTLKANAGGCSYVVLIDEDNKYNTINSFCV